MGGGSVPVDLSALKVHMQGMFCLGQHPAPCRLSVVGLNSRGCRGQGTSTLVRA